MNGLFCEIGTIILSEGKRLSEIKKTMGSILSQTRVSRKICIVSAKKQGPIPANWVRKMSKECAKIGVYEFSYIDVVADYRDKKDLIVHAVRDKIGKKMKIVVHTNEGDKKSKEAVSHIAVIPAGAVYNNDKYNETIFNRYVNGERSHVYYGDYIKDGVKYSSPFDSEEIAEEYPKAFYHNSLKFWIDRESEDSIIKQFTDIHNKREENKEKSMNNENEYNDHIFTYVKELSTCESSE